MRLSLLLLFGLWLCPALAEVYAWPRFHGGNQFADIATETANARAQINLRRSQIGLPQLAQHPLADIAALGHSKYLASNNLTGHFQSSQFPMGFTGADPGARLTNAGYTQQTYSEVIAFGAASGVLAIEDLLQAIYHRFGIFATNIDEVGIGYVDNHPTYKYVMTADLVSRSSTIAQSSNWVGTYPFDGQTQVPIDFFTDEESPDPVAGVNRVGYAVSLHVDGNVTLSTSSFTLSNPAGAVLPTKLLTNSGDSNTPKAVAAIIPLSVLDYGATYTAHYVGAVNNTALDKTWSFTTTPLLNVVFSPATPTAGIGISFTLSLSGGSGRFTSYSLNNPIIGVAALSPNTLQITTKAAGSATLTVTDSDGRSASTVITIRSGAGDPTAGFNAGATASGSNSSLTLVGKLTVAAADVGQSGSVFLAAQVGNAWYVHNGATWLALGASIPAYQGGSLPATLEIPILAGTNVTPLCQTAVFIGYGKDAADMLSKNQYKQVYTLCQ